MHSFRNFVISENFRLGRDNRRIVLYGCALCRELWSLLDTEGKTILEKVEQIADGKNAGLSVEELRNYRLVAHAERKVYYHDAKMMVLNLGQFARGWRTDLNIENDAIRIEVPYRIIHEDIYGYDPMIHSSLNRWRTPDPPEMPTGLIDQNWMTWGGGTVAKLAAAIYDGNRFNDLPILADALEEAGCDNPLLLGHARGNVGHHHKGCWLIDLLTGRL